jgi:hypothetical protein
VNLDYGLWTSLVARLEDFEVGLDIFIIGEQALEILRLKVINLFHAHIILQQFDQTYLLRY